jgi:AraC-like DNA-binding protein
LAAGDVPQKEIAERSGFPNLHAFHTAFRRRHHTTPAQFRARLFVTREGPRDGGSK